MSQRLLLCFSLNLILFTRLIGQTEATPMDTLSYSVGVLMAQNLKQQGLDKLDSEVVAQALNDVLNGQSLKVSVSEANNYVQRHMMAQRTQQYAPAIEEGRAFLAENAKRPGVTSLPSGLQYEVLAEGQGASPGPNDRVTVHYRGTLINGEVFDSSIDRGQPATFGVTQVIQGWVEALQLMKEGAKWKLFIPYQLAYGERGSGPKIGPYATLIFEVELLKIN
jgi:FKBP-type peptidyl-prolyl cis-trans isomerase FklB